jgi:iron complex outermembrane receptor protein
MVRIRALFLSSAVATLLTVWVGGSVAIAQEADSSRAPDQSIEPQGPPDIQFPDPAKEPSAPPPGIEAIEVTGERLNDADVQDEASAITAFTAEDLDRANIVNVDALAFNVPGLHVGQSGQAPIITLRGIGTENSSLTGEPGVAFHVDGINLSRPSAARVAFFDLETLDVKRGPQGLLGGKNSTSGSINLITRKPTDEYEVTGDVLLGNYDRVRYRGALNVPLGEYAATRFAFYQEERDGYLDNPRLSDGDDPFDTEDLGLRTHLKLNPSDSLELLFSWDWFSQEGSGPQADIVPIDRYNLDCGGVFVEHTVMPLAAACFKREVVPAHFEIQIINGRPTPVFVPAVIAFEPATEDSDPRSVYLDIASAQENRYWGWGSHIDYDTPELPLLGETHLKLLGGFHKTINVFNQDFDTTDVALFAYELDDWANQYTGELQWSGMLSEQLEWQTSLFYAHEKASRDVVTPDLGGVGGGVESEQTTNNKSYGAALHGIYHFTDNLRFSLGGRFIKDRKSTELLRTALAVTNENRFRGCTGNLGTDLIPGVGFLVPGRANDECSLVNRHTMWGSGLDWRPFGDDHLLYARIDRGAKSGGFRAGTVGEYLPEKIWAYSLGLKSEFFDQRMRVNLEGFAYSYQNLQLVILDGLSLRTENTDARMYGWDLESMLAPIDGMVLSATVSFMKTEAIDYFSLDTVDVDPFQLARLSQRELADANEAEGRGGLSYTELECYRSATDNTRVPCGQTGDRYGLDDFSGNELSRAPRWKMTVSGEYEIPLGAWGSLTPRVQYSWQDDTYFRVFNREFDLQEDYHLTDAKLIWTSPEQRWSVEVFVQNIEDETPKQNILVAPREIGAPPLAWYGPPRFYGVQVGFKY